MSHAPSASSLRSGPPSRLSSPKLGSSVLTLPPLKTAEAARTHGHRASHGQGTDLESPADGRNGEPPSARSLKMQSILNPPSHEDRRASAPDSSRRPSELHSASPNGQSGPHRALPPVTGLTSPYGPAGTHDSSRRAGPPPVTMSGGHNKSPFASTASTPLLGTPITARATYGFPGASATSSERRGSDSIHTAPQSLTNSPTTSYSSYVPTQRNSPTMQHSQMAAPSAPLGGHYGHHGNSGQAPTIMLAGSEAAYRNGHSSTQSSYQMMTLETDQGPIQVPVDVQAASKMADEKRKRNAGASARFRARRKEKEREASQTISRLESKVREVAEEKEYYRMERDYFRDLVYNSTASAHVTPRMPSPKQRKGTISSSSGSGAGDDWQQSGERGSDDGRNQRRRISTYSEPAPPPMATAAYPAPPSSTHHSNNASPTYSYPRPGGSAPTPNQGPLPIAHGHHHYVSTAPTTYTQAWKPPVS